MSWEFTPFWMMPIDLDCSCRSWLWKLSTATCAFIFDWFFFPCTGPHVEHLLACPKTSVTRKKPNWKRLIVCPSIAILPRRHQSRPDQSDCWVICSEHKSKTVPPGYRVENTASYCNKTVPWVPAVHRKRMKHTSIRNIWQKKHTNASRFEDASQFQNESMEKWTPHIKRYKMDKALLSSRSTIRRLSRNMGSWHSARYRNKSRLPWIHSSFLWGAGLYVILGPLDPTKAPLPRDQIFLTTLQTQKKLIILRV